MDWLTQNWIFVVFFVLFIGMHLFGHGGHGGHGGGCGGEHDREPADKARPGKDSPQGHKHHQY